MPVLSLCIFINYYVKLDILAQINVSYCTIYKVPFVVLYLVKEGADRPVITNHL